MSACYELLARLRQVGSTPSHVYYSVDRYDDQSFPSPRNLAHHYTIISRRRASIFHIVLQPLLNEKIARPAAAVMRAGKASASPKAAAAGGDVLAGQPAGANSDLPSSERWGR